MASLRLERKKSDFHSGGAVTAYTGSGCCCCCCCLHWVGAAIGGGVGLKMGWAKQEKIDGQPVHSEIRHVLSVSIAVGFLLTLVPIVLAMAISGSNPLSTLSMAYLAAAAVVPTVVFVPGGVLMMLSQWRIRRRLHVAYGREQLAPPPQLPKEGGAYREPNELALHEAHDLAALDGFETSCPVCWTTIGRGTFASHCPSCNEAIALPRFREVDQGIKTAWRATWTSCAGSFVGGLAGYAAMALIALVYSLAQ